MKRIQIIAAALCLIMITTIGAGVVAAKQTENPRQAGTSSIYFYDVAPAPDGTHGKGKLQINVDQHTFEFNGKGFDPSAQIALKAQADGSTDYTIFATGKATPSGNLHIAGTWEAAAAPVDVVGAVSYTQIGGFMLENLGWFVAQLACYYSTDNGVTWHESGHTSGIAKSEAYPVTLSDLGVPDGALVKIHAIVIAGKDRTGSEVFQYSRSFEANDNLPGACTHAFYDIQGTTLTSKLIYMGILVWE